MIYTLLQGRIGNQLFIYSAAESLQKRRGQNEQIIVDDSRVLALDWLNALKNYSIDNVKFTSGENKNITIKIRLLILRIFNKLVANCDYNQRYEKEKIFNKFFNPFGIIICANGYLDYKIPKTKNVVIEGYFQSEKYFENVSTEIREIFSCKEQLEKSNYNNLDIIKNRNTVCISIKVEHNIGSSIFDVCSDGYWERAINYITQNVENPLFFICSDDVEYVINNLIDCDKFDYVCQDISQPVHISLAAMACCKHFIIGNTSYGWWAQHLSEAEDKIVVAPSKWMAVDMPIDIYQDNWHLENV